MFCFVAGDICGRGGPGRGRGRGEASAAGGRGVGRGRAGRGLSATAGRGVGGLGSMGRGVSYDKNSNTATLYVELEHAIEIYHAVRGFETFISNVNIFCVKLYGTCCLAMPASLPGKLSHACRSPGIQD